MQIQKSASLENGSATVIVPDENLAAQLQAGHIFMTDDELVPYWIASTPTYSTITEETTVVLTAPYAGTTGVKDCSFSIDFTLPDLIPLITPGDVGTATLFSEAMNRIQALMLAATPEGFSAVAQYAIDAQADADAAAASAAAALASQVAAAASATGSASSATTATTAATDATAQVPLATAQATAAATSATNADTSEAKAMAWADETENVEVEAGKYSARHWALQTAASVLNQLIYRGQWDASSGSYPASPAAGDFYRVSVAGTVATIDYGIGDSIYYTGSAWNKIGVSFTGSDVITALGYTPVNAATYTAADVLAKLLTVDGAGTGIDADLLDGQQGAWYSDIAARLGYTPANLAGATFSGPIDAGMRRYRDEITTIAGDTATTILDLDADTTWLVNLSSSTTLELDGVIPTDCVFYLTVFLKQDATGGRTIALPASFLPDDGVAPTWVTDPSKMDVLSAWTIDGGVTWFYCQAFRNLG